MLSEIEPRAPYTAQVFDREILGALGTTFAWDGHANSATRVLKADSASGSLTIVKGQQRIRSQQLCDISTVGYRERSRAWFYKLTGGNTRKRKRLSERVRCA